MKQLSDLVASAIISAMETSDPEAHFNRPGSRPGTVYIEGSFDMADIARSVLAEMALAFTEEAKRYEGAMSGGEVMNTYRDISRILKGAR